MDVVKITIVRHGQTNWNKEGIVQGWESTSLNTEGIAYIGCLADYLNNQKYDMILTSDLLRARQTAQIFSDKCNLPIKCLESLRERELGELQGTYENSVPIGSSKNSVEPTILFVRRIVSIFNRIAKGEWGTNILVITHGGPIRVIQQHCLGRVGLQYDNRLPLVIECQKGVFHSFSVLECNVCQD